MCTGVQSVFRGKLLKKYIFCKVLVKSQDVVALSGQKSKLLNGALTIMKTCPCNI